MSARKAAGSAGRDIFDEEKDFMIRKAWIAVGAVALAAVGCGKKAPLVVGLIGDLPTAKNVADSGFKNGAFLAVGDINEKGGVAGREIDLALEDDDGDPGLVPRMDERLFAKGAVALVGHNTSATTAASLPGLARRQVMLMGPEATSSQFAGKQDYFVRNEVREKFFAEVLADYAVQKLHLRSVGAILDEKNTPFSRPFFEAFEARMSSLGAKAEIIYAYENASAEEAARQTAAFLGRGGAAILLVTGGEDTRKLGLAVRRVKDTVPLLGTPWVMPPSHVHQLGPLPEELVFTCTWDPDSQAPAYLAFKKAYEGRFGTPVDYHAVHAYEALNIVALGLEKAKAKPANLPNAISAIARFNGLQGPIQIDAFGDCRREMFVLKVTGGNPHRVASAPAG